MKKIVMAIGEARCEQCDEKEFRLFICDTGEFALVCKACETPDFGWRPPEDHPQLQKVDAVVKRHRDKMKAAIGMFGVARGTA